MFLEKLGEVQEKWGLVVHGYCLMSNHYHLEVETLEGNISRSMQWLNNVYAGYINKKYKRVGHLFQGRFKWKNKGSNLYRLSENANLLIIIRVTRLQR